MYHRYLTIAGSNLNLMFKRKIDRSDACLFRTPPLKRRHAIRSLIFANVILYKFVFFNYVEQNTHANIGEIHPSRWPLVPWYVEWRPTMHFQGAWNKRRVVIADYNDTPTAPLPRTMIFKLESWIVWLTMYMRQADDVLTARLHFAIGTLMSRSM